MLSSGVGSEVGAALAQIRLMSKLQPVFGKGLTCSGVCQVFADSAWS